jgi:hypothetical protein
MLIVNPPKQNIQLIEETTAKGSNNILDVDYLEFEELDKDYLDGDSLEFSELDYNWLDVNFLEDLLDILDELEVIQEEDQLAQDATTLNIVGTRLGQDLETQITTYMTGEKLTIIRSVNNTARVDVDSDTGYTVIFIQDGVSRVVSINGGEGSTIKITQSN